MGAGSSGEGNAHMRFFFKLVGGIAEEYPIVFNGRGSNKPRAQEYRDFAQRWGFTKTLYEICDEKIEKIGEVYQMYLNDFLQYLTYMIDKQQAEEAQDKFDEQMRKARKGR